MSTYHVSFFKNLLSSDGHPFKCLQRRIEVSDVESAAQATESASRAFEALYGCPWKLHARARKLRNLTATPATALLRNVGIPVYNLRLWLNMLGFQWLPKPRIVEQIDFVPPRDSSRFANRNRAKSCSLSTSTFPHSRLPPPASK